MTEKNNVFQSSHESLTVALRSRCPATRRQAFICHNSFSGQISVVLISPVILGQTLVSGNRVSDLATGSRVSLFDFAESLFFLVARAVHNSVGCYISCNLHGPRSVMLHKRLREFVPTFCFRIFCWVVFSGHFRLHCSKHAKEAFKRFRRRNSFTAAVGA